MPVSSDPPPRWPVAARLALYYAAYFAVVGVQLPFWPAWLASRGLGRDQIGWLTAAGCFVVTLVGPWVAQVADRRNARKRLMLGFVWSSTACFALFVLGSGFAWLLAVNMVFAA